MSRENVELVSRGFAAATAKPKPDFDTVNELFATDHVLVPATAGVRREEFAGKDWYRAFIGDKDEEPLFWEHSELEGALDIGPDRVLAVFNTRFRGANSGVEMDYRVWGVIQIRSGKICRTEFYPDPNDALDAARKG